MKSFEKLPYFFFKLGDFAPWRENSRIRVLSVSESFAQAAQIFNYSSKKHTKLGNCFNSSSVFADCHFERSEKSFLDSRSRSA